jgi:hypothetical protein
MCVKVTEFQRGTTEQSGLLLLFRSAGDPWIPCESLLVELGKVVPAYAFKAYGEVVI